MTAPKTLPLHNKLKESKVNSGNVLSAQPSWVNTRPSPPSWEAPGGELPRAPAAPPRPPRPRLRGALRRGLGPPPRLPRLGLLRPPHSPCEHLAAVPTPRGGGVLGGGQGSSLQHPLHPRKRGVPGQSRTPGPVTAPALCLPESPRSPEELGAFRGRRAHRLTGRQMAGEAGRRTGASPGKRPGHQDVCGFVSLPSEVPGSR